VINFGHKGERIPVRCPICLGLGTYEEDENWEPPKKSETTVAVHSTILDLEDILDLLPERHVTHDETTE
jgi:hypothetical protein